MVPHLAVVVVGGEGRLRLGRGTVPGAVERVELWAGAGLLTSAEFVPPIDNGIADVELRLGGWPDPRTELTVCVYFRRHQPTGDGPMARSGFPLLIGDVMTENTAPPTAEAAAPGSSPPPEPDTDLHLYDATFDYGTTRSVCAVYRKAATGLSAALPADWQERAGTAMSGQRPRADEDTGLFVDRATAGVPLMRDGSWRSIFASPPLSRHFLQATDALPSVLGVKDGTVDFLKYSPGQSIRVSSAKRYMITPDREIPHAGLTGTQLFPQVYARFKARAEDDKKLGLTHPIMGMSLTYPVRLPADLREELLAKVIEKVGLRPELVSMDFDEAVAASGFSMMRRLGADVVLGVEAFKLTARCPEGGRAWEDAENWDSAHSWHENLLVIDVGGGTTDVALVKVAIDDETPRDLGNAPGRYYRLRPRRLASGGRLNLGGDKITLSLLLMLKDKIGIGVASEETQFDGVTGADRETRTALFHKLWDAAELVKQRG